MTSASDIATFDRLAHIIRVGTNCELIAVED